QVFALQCDIDPPGLSEETLPFLIFYGDDDLLKLPFFPFSDRNTVSRRTLRLSPAHAVSSLHLFLKFHGQIRMDIHALLLHFSLSPYIFCDIIFSLSISFSVKKYAKNSN